MNIEPKDCNECGEIFSPTVLVAEDEYMCPCCEQSIGPTDAEMDYIYGSDGWRNQ